MAVVSPKDIDSKMLGAIKLETFQILYKYDHLPLLCDDCGKLMGTMLNSSINHNEVNCYECILRRQDNILHRAD